MDVQNGAPINMDFEPKYTAMVRLPIERENFEWLKTKAKDEYKSLGAALGEVFATARSIKTQ